MDREDTAERELERTREQWEALGARDAMWAVLTRPDKRGGRWSPDEFFATGRREIATVMDHLRGLGLEPERSGAALDFGCGVGRLTQALADHFARVAGVDIAEAMLAKAREFNRFGERVEYVVNTDARLPFADGAFAFSYSSIVLQHVPPEAIPAYIAELVRVTSGIAVFNVPEPGLSPRLDVATLHRALALARVRLALRTRLRRARGRGNGEHEPPMLMGGLPERDVRRTVAGAGGAVRDVTWTSTSWLESAGELRLGERPRTLMAGKQYVVTRAR